MKALLFYRWTQTTARFFARRTTANTVTVGRCFVALFAIPIWIFCGWNERLFALALAGLFFADVYSTIKRGFGKKTAVVGANNFGKWKTVLQIVAFFSFALGELFALPSFVANGLLCGALGLGIVSIGKRMKDKSCHGV